MSNEWGTPEPSAQHPPAADLQQSTPAPVPSARDAAAAPARVEDVERAHAVRELKRRREFLGTLGGWASVSAITTTVWVVAGADGYFWPIWPMVGIGIGVVGQAASIWGPTKKDITEADIAAEMRRREQRGR